MQRWTTSSRDLTNHKGSVWSFNQKKRLQGRCSYSRVCRVYQKKNGEQDASCIEPIPARSSKEMLNHDRDTRTLDTTCQGGDPSTQKTTSQEENPRLSRPGRSWVRLGARGLGGYICDLKRGPSRKRWRCERSGAAAHVLRCCGQVGALRKAPPVR